MYIEINGITYRVKFFTEGNMTFAELYKVEVDGILTQAFIDGVAILHPNDHFEKAKGRKVALADLLENLEGILWAISNYRLTKNERTLIWEEYFKTFKK